MQEDEGRVDVGRVGRDPGEIGGRVVTDHLVAVTVQRLLHPGRPAKGNLTLSRHPAGDERQSQFCHTPSPLVNFPMPPRVGAVTVIVSHRAARKQPKARPPGQPVTLADRPSHGAPERVLPAEIG